MQKMEMITGKQPVHRETNSCSE